MPAVPHGYVDWLSGLKNRIRSAQLRATVAVNVELVRLYWEIGKDILDKQKEQGWGSKVIEWIARDLRSTFPEMRGFSRTNLLYMRSFAEAWPDETIVQQLVGQLPWGHNLVILSRLKQRQEREWYATKAIEHGWSRNILGMQIETKLHERQGKAVTNFHHRKEGNRLVAEYALRNIESPMGVAEYQLVQAIPTEFATSLPTVEQIESELQNRSLVPEDQEPEC